MACDRLVLRRGLRYAARMSSENPTRGGGMLKLLGLLFAFNAAALIWVGVQLQRLNGDYSTGIVGGVMAVVACFVFCAGIVANNRDR